MKIWNIHVGEPNSFINTVNRDRIGRANSLSFLLAKNGHDVTHFGGHFSHVRRDFEPVYPNTKLASAVSGLSYVLLGSSGYKKNISFARIWDHCQLAVSFYKFLKKADEIPDLIVVSVPTIELAFAVSIYAKIKRIRVIVDFRDLWPEIFLYHYIKNQKIVVRFLNRLLPWYWMNRFIFRNSSMITTVGEGFASYVVDTYLREKHRKKVITIYQSQKNCTSVRIRKNHSMFRFLWTGNIVAETDFYTLKEAIKKLAKDGRKFEVWIAGNGSVIHGEKEFFSEYSRNIKILGWLNADQLSKAIDSCDIGLLCYLDRVDFRMAIQNKVIDYLRQGLPIIGSINGELRRLDETEGTNIYKLYEFGDVNSLVNVMEECIQQGISYMQRRNCIELFDNYFSFTSVQEQWLDIVNGE